MKKRLLLMLAVLLVAQPFGTRRALAMTDAPEKAAMLPPEVVLPICDRALAAAVEGKDGGEVIRDAVKALPKAQADQVNLVCQIYALGAMSLLKHSQEAAEALRARQRTI